MNSARLLSLACCAVLVAVLGACSPSTSADKTAPVAAGGTEPALPAMRESAVATIGAWAEAELVLPGDETYLAAAKQFGFALYKPTTLPEGFAYLEAESTSQPDLVATVYGRDADRLLVIQGIWDIGDDPEMTFSEGARWGSSPAEYVDGIGFAWTGAAYGQDAEAVLALNMGHGASYAVMGVGVARDDLLTVAAGMKLVQ